MPYINPERRKALAASEISAHSAGELNYQFSALINRYINTHLLCYQSINDVIGALEGAKMEFYRRVAAPYEDTKFEQNGDVYDENMRAS